MAHGDYGYPELMGDVYYIYHSRPPTYNRHLVGVRGIDYELFKPCITGIFDHLWGFRYRSALLRAPREIKRSKAKMIIKQMKGTSIDQKDVPFTGDETNAVPIGDIPLFQRMDIKPETAFTCARKLEKQPTFLKKG